MPTGLPAATGDVLTAASYNSLVAFTVGTANTGDYTAVLADQYQVLEVMNKATAIAFKIPTDASVAFPVGTALTVLSAGAVPASPVLAQYKTAVCIKTAANTWYVVGGIA